MEDPVDERDVEQEGQARIERGSDPNGLVGSKLRALYRAIEEEPVPDFFIDLLQRLDDAEALGQAEDKASSQT